MRNNPRNWQIADLEAIAIRFGMAVRKGKGSHVTFSHAALAGILTVPAHRPIKPIYVKKIGINPGRKEHVGVTAKDNRNFINGVLWIFKTGAPWRDLPERYGNWKNIHRRFSRWAKTGVFDSIFRILSEDADLEFLLMDGAIVKAHQHAAGAKKK
jgi:transposase